MTKDVNQMNSIEYAEYKMQQNRTWKNQQYDRARKDYDKQRTERFIKDGLGLVFGEMKANANYNLETMHLNNLTDSIQAVANYASANDIQKERERLLNQFGTPEAVWSYQAAAKAFRNPEIASLNIASVKDLETAVSNKAITPEQYFKYLNSYEIETNRYKDLWENNKSFDKYNDNYVTTRTAQLKALRETKPTISGLGLITGKDKEARELIQNNYDLIFDENSAISTALATRESIKAGNTKTTVSQKEIDNVVASKLSAATDVPFNTIKATIADEISKSRIYSSAKLIEARFDNLVREKFKNNESFDARDLWNEAKIPYMQDFNYNELAAMNKFVTDNINRVNPDVLEGVFKERFGIEIDFTAKAPITYGLNALTNGTRISNELAAQIGATDQGNRFLKQHPEIINDTVKSWNNLQTERKDSYKLDAENRLKSSRALITDKDWLTANLGEAVALSLDVDTKARKKVLDQLFNTTGGQSPKYVHQSILDQFNSIVGLTIYDVERNDTLSFEDKNRIISKKIIDLVDNLEIKDKVLTLNPFSDIAFKQFNPSKSSQDNIQYNPAILKLNKAVNNYNLAEEAFKNNLDDNEAKQNMLVNAAIIIDAVVKQDPSINTIQKLRESSLEMVTLLNSIELATPTTSIQELLEYLPKASNDDIAQNIPAPSSTQELIGPPRPTGTQTPAPTPAPDLTKEEPEVVAEALPLVASDDVYNSFTKDQKKKHDSLNESLQEINADLEDPTNLTTKDIQKLTKRKTDIERSLRNLIRGSAFYINQEKNIQKELDAIERQLEFRRDVLTQQDIQDLRAKQVELREQLKLEQTKSSDYVDPKLLQPSLLSRS